MQLKIVKSVGVPFSSLRHTPFDFDTLLSVSPLSLAQFSLYMLTHRCQPIESRLITDYTLTVQKKCKTSPSPGSASSSQGSVRRYAHKNNFENGLRNVFILRP